VETSRPLLDAKQQQLNVVLPPQPVYLNIDAVRMAQVVANLLNNAAKYSERRSRVDLSAEKMEAELLIRVRDNGVGIKAEMLPHVFDLFTQSERNLAQSEGGLGIGLALVRRLVELHGGKVSASSAGPGQGSEFVIRLPWSDDAESTRPDDIAPTRPTMTPLRILVVDDNKDAAASLGMLLRIGRHQIETANSGDQALDIAARQKPQVVILDLGLPQMDGFEVAKRLRQQPGMEKALFIALTGYGGEEDRQRSQQASFSHHFTKPIELPALEAALAGFTASQVPRGNDN
jgi:two-component system CheB/CheR fusion protein